MRCSLPHRRLLITGLVSLASTAVSADPPLDPDFLLYLEQMRQVDGEWVDPMMMEELEIPGDRPEESKGANAQQSPEEEGSHED